MRPKGTRSSSRASEIGTADCPQCGKLYRRSTGWCEACSWVEESKRVDATLDRRRIDAPLPAPAIEQALASS